MKQNGERKHWSGRPNIFGLLVSPPMLILYAAAALIQYPSEISHFLWNNTHETLARVFDRFWIETFLRAIWPWVDRAHIFIAFLGVSFLVIRLCNHWTITSDRLLMRRGVLFRTVDEIELYRVMDVRSSRGPIQFLTGTGNVRVMSSDASGTVHMTGVFRPGHVRDLVRGHAENCKSRRGVRLVE